DLGRLLPHGSSLYAGEDASLPEPQPVEEAPLDIDAKVLPSRDGDVVQVDATDLLASLDDGIMCLDAGGIVVLANASANAMCGLRPGHSFVGSPLRTSSALRTEDGQVVARDQHPAMLTLADGIARDVHILVGDEGDGERHVTLSARPFPVDGRAGALVVLRDTTAEWLEQQRLTHYALYDPLTGLANRYLLLEELRRMLQGLGRRGGSVTLIYMDLDDFKSINDEHGHDMGDEVLGAFARRLRGAVRGDDVVCRLGGDEFVIAHATAGPPDGDLVVSRLRKVLSAPFTVRGLTFDLGASIGWVSTEKGDVGPDVLVATADRAMYRHKRDRAASRRSTT
ncbi:MAG: GGDEF domain-containing protein, partial [Acidimicrobiales bacterium]